MKANTQFTKDPVMGYIKPMSGARKVVDNDGALLCFLRMDRLYDLNHVCFASCRRVDKAEQVGNADAFVTDGKYLYKKGVVVGKLKFDYSYLKILALLAILAVAVTSLVVVTREKKEPIVPEFSVYDTNGEWIDGGEVKIFGNRTIKPGDSGSYMFIVNNPHSVDLYCIIRFTVNYENKKSLPPVRYQVKSEGQTLKLSEIENGFAVYDLTISKKNSRSFTLEWQWLFESGNDTQDTLAGIAGSKYSIKIEIAAEEA